MAVDTATDTSVNSEDTSSLDDDVELEDIEVDLTDIESEAEDEVEAEEADTDTDDEAADDEPSDEEATDEQSEEAEPELSDEQRQAEHNKQMFELRQQEKEARIARVRDAQQAYVAEAAQNEDPLDTAVRQLQVDAYNNTVDKVESTVKNDYQRALNDFEVLRTSDPVIQSEIDQAINAFQAQHLTIDQFGNPVDLRGDLYATLQAKADSIAKLTGIRAKRQEQSKGREKSKTLATPTRAPRTPKVDPDMAAFDEEAGW